MDRKNKIVVIGSKSVHVVNFLQLIKPYFNRIVTISDEEIDSSLISKQHVINVKFLSPFILINQLKELKRIIKSEQPDIIHIQQVNRLAFFIVLAVKQLKIEIPIVTTAWGSDVLLMPQKNMLFKRMVTYVLKHSNYCTADSNHMLEVIKSLTPTVKTKLVLFGIDPIQSLPKEKIIYSNRLHNPLYNIEQVLDEFYKFSINNPDWKLVIGATGSLTEALKNKVKTLELTNNVEFIGWVPPDVNNLYYAKSYIYVSIPSSDGTAVSLLEAMSAGCIPVVSNLPVSKEWIADGENGVIFNSTKNNFEEALKLKLETVQQLNNTIISERGTKEISSNLYKEIYRELLHQ